MTPSLRLALALGLLCWSAVVLGEPELSQAMAAAFIFAALGIGLLRFGSEQ
jgi:hypothetical protein